MCPRDDFLHTIEFEKFFIIKPAIDFTSRNTDFTQTCFNEIGKPVPANFEYNSLNNPHYLTVEELVELNKHV